MVEKRRGCSAVAVLIFTPSVIWVTEAVGVGITDTTVMGEITEELGGLAEDASGVRLV